MDWMHNNQKPNDATKPSIDELLASESQKLVMRTVKALPEDVPSMAWRGSLNAKLAAEAARRRSRRRLWLVVSPSFGLAAAAAICFAVLMPGHRTAGSVPPKQTMSAQSSSLEDQLFASHSDSVTSQDVVGSGLSTAEVQQSNEDSGAEDTPSS